MTIPKPWQVARKIWGAGGAMVTSGAAESVVGVEFRREAARFVSGLLASEGCGAGIMRIKIETPGKWLLKALTSFSCN
jgi:hypothetical protein